MKMLTTSLPHFYLSASKRRSSAKASILEVPGASFWDLWGAFWRYLEGPGLSFGRHWSFLVTGLNLTHFLHRILVHFGTILARPNFSKIEKVFKKYCPKRGLKTVGSQGTSKTARCVIRTVDTICSEGSGIRELYGFGFPFGSLLGSLFHTIRKKCHPRLQEPHKSHIKNNGKRCCN